MLYFLVDANLSARVVTVFNDIGFRSDYVNDNTELCHESDEIIFDYAVKNKAIIVTQDLGFTNPLRFDLKKLSGLIIIRFPNQILISTITEKLSRLIKDFKEEDFLNHIIIIEPGSVRKRIIG